MGRMTSTCMNCGSPKTQGDFLADYCTECLSASAGAEAAATAANEDPSQARRAALAARAHTAHRNFPDPRTADRRTLWNYGNAPSGTIQGAAAAAEQAEKA